MCAIAGLIGMNPTLQQSVIDAFVDLVAHRGPDGRGVWADEHLVLGHRRLAIQDLSDQGHQPMMYQDRWVVSFNGEVYNFPELRKELIELGHTFVTQTDTEVLVAAFVQWGVAAFCRCNGMWAALIYDTQTRQLTLTRDRFGVKPMYLWQPEPGTLAVASEIKQFSVLPGWSARLNPQRARDFLVWGLLDHTQETLFDGVYALKPGTAVTWCVSDWHHQRGRLTDLLRKAQTWFDVGQAVAHQRAANTCGASDDLAASSSTYHELLRSSVQLRLRADVPVGSCLSGGLDSSSIVCLIHDCLPASARQEAVTSVSSDPRFDESLFAKAVVDATGISWHTVEARYEQFANLLDDLVWTQDEPFGSTSLFAQWLVFQKAAEQGLKVMLDGQGADEQLAGYGQFTGPALRDLLAQGRWRIWWRSVLQLTSTLGLKRVLMVMARSYLPVGLLNRARRWLGSSAVLDSNPDWLGPFPATNQALCSDSPIPNEAFQSVEGLSVAMLERSSLPMLLHWEDRSSMAHGVEARVPFLDYRLVPFVVAQPTSIKWTALYPKQLLRQAMRALLPAKVLLRTDKMGFVTAEQAWIEHDASHTIRTWLTQAIEQSQGIIQPSALVMFDEMVAGRQPYNPVIWRWITFGRWLRRFNVRLGAS